MNRKIIISGGGTGGHVFPALAIAREIKKQDPQVSLLFVGAKGRLEMEKIPASGFPIIGLPVEGFRRKLTLRNFLVLFKLIISLFKSSHIIRSFKPDGVIGVGGYASGPVMFMATLHRIPVFIQEQNSYAGVTNRMLGSKAAKIFVAYPDMNRYFPKERIILSGNPVREELVHIKAPAEEAFTYFKLKNDRPVILILGGSLGAGTVNESVIRHVDRIEHENVQVLWQTGKLYFEGIVEKTKNREFKNLRIMAFINRMELAYRVADIIVSRAGAGTISELCCVGKPVILVPSPNVAEDHQTKNALSLVKRKAALMVRDQDAASMLIPMVMELIRNEEQQSELSKNCKELALPGGRNI